MKGTYYTIMSKPDYIEFICPHCEEEVKTDFSNVNFNSDYWGDGAWVDCPNCEEQVELGDYEYC